MFLGDTEWTDRAMSMDRGEYAGGIEEARDIDAKISIVRSAVVDGRDTSNGEIEEPRDIDAGNEDDSCYDFYSVCYHESCYCCCRMLDGLGVLEVMGCYR
eukprot:59196_1